MLLTHLCFFQFLGGASPAPVVIQSGFGGSSTAPPFYLYDGFSPANTPTPVVVIDTHDGVDAQKKHIKRYVDDKRDLRERLNRAIRQSKGIIDEVPAEVASVRTAIRTALTAEDMAEVRAEVAAVAAQIYKQIAIEKQRLEDDDDDDVLMLLNS